MDKNNAEGQCTAPSGGQSGFVYFDKNLFYDVIMANKESAQQVSDAPN